MSTSYMALYLNRELNRQGRSRRWLADRIGIDPSLISHYTRLSRPIPAERANRIAQHLGVPISVICDVRPDTSSEPQAPGGSQ